MFAAIYIFLLQNVQIAVKIEKTPVLCQNALLSKKKSGTDDQNDGLYPD
ncbi:hypothetical protein SAMN05192529_10259 [Arachidicoccus rhizosphaerae]|jgi:hypothetical protein|uniref:Uncharacterized protein n=1 Tax=Arachidicoccus rhizosphaerae TaxID=551991 RepID=A0A1H3W1G5_9BACT|nr:hypothetical protein SAMN05192529_10259 [Arachidicoccus rhizosphaerae]